MIDYHAELYAFAEDAALILARAHRRLDAILVAAREVAVPRRRFRFQAAFSAGEIAPALEGRADIVMRPANPILEDYEKIERGESVRPTERLGGLPMRWRVYRSGGGS